MRQRLWRLAHGREIALAERSRIMAIVNVTPDSFSDGGRHATLEAAFRHSLGCLEDGADILDIGGESTRPGASDVSPAEEQDRVLPLVSRLSKETDALISIDTYRAETAALAIAEGAHIINDVWGLQREPAIADVAAKTGAGICIMHTGRGRTPLSDPIEDQRQFFARSLEICKQAGVRAETIVLDPGFGFGKETVEANMALMARLDELQELGFPLLVGTSRKRFLGALTGREPQDRDVATAASSVLGRLKGASLFRVHDVCSNRDALALADAMVQTGCLKQKVPDHG
ncbi:dihydropteroate synthase [Allorhizobium sp. BGMRC 0089]|uniref:dihydropteroate synthase n=1 Tax=Allorhizobium sonneratiae TaxID=2934936 RepID=UPI002033A972|nr:dihydropteroate synthase [Allorhizobium sonneratiae]MCM2292800.1 dihydropteroate synthase [Allorhizobium sonneratiae]